MAEVSVIIVNYRTPELTIRCVKALCVEKARLPQLRVVVVDGGSRDSSAADLSAFLSRSELNGWVSFLPLSTNGGFGWANNQAILQLSRETKPPDFVHLLNPDTEVTEGAVSALVAELQTLPCCAAAGSRLLTPDGRTAASAFRFPTPGREFIGAAQSEKLGKLLGISSTVVTSDESVDVDWVTGASVMFRAEALRESGLFDDGFFLYWEEVELMHRLAERGWTVRHVPKSQVVHIEGASTGLGPASAERPHPAYWYDSRRRYFGLTAGTVGLTAANLALLGGKVAAAVKAIGGRPVLNKACRSTDVLTRCFLPRGADLVSSVPGWGDEPGRLPAWMERE